MKNRTRLMFQAMELVKELWPPPLIPFIFLRKKDYDRLGLSEIDDEEQDLLDKGVDVRDTGTPSDWAARLS